MKKTIKGISNVEWNCLYSGDLNIKGIQMLTMAILFLFSVSSTSLYAIQSETLLNLTNEDRVISAPQELHLTSPDAPLVNSSVTLNHEDAWLFFDNLKPSEVLENFAANIFVNGDLLNSGINGRVAIYGQGTVIMPHPSSFQALKAYSDENYGGKAQYFNLHTYYNQLGEMDDTIKSFKLKRGYMATFANGADGSGYSRVFVADKEDLEFSVMPAELYGSVSFIRVFKHQWVNKKGKAGWNPHDINATSYYDWNIGGNSSDDVEYAAIRQNGGWPSWASIGGKQNISHLLGFNEPDRPDQADMNFQEMIDLWPGMMQSGLRIGSPAWSNAWGGNGGNLFDFINKCDELNYRVDFVAVHCYWGGKSPSSWYYDLKDIYNRTGRPLWITEWNNGANWTSEGWPDSDRSYTEANAQKQLNDLKGILEVMDTASFVERYFIYDWVEDCRAMWLNDNLTLAGEYYAANKSQIAYKDKNEVIPHWNFEASELSLRYLSLSNSIRLGWTDNNGELSAGYKLEKKVNDGDYEILYNTEDISETFYLDPLNTEKGGTFSYRFSIVTKDENYIVSDEVSYHQTNGSDSIQLGSFKLNSSEWSSSYYSEKYNENPLVFMGIPSYNNTFPLTQRVSNISATRFKFQIKPWAYLNDPKIRSTEDLAAMILPAGLYDFFGLAAEAKMVEDVGREWITIQFDQEFSVVPAVFCTIISNSTVYPLTVAIRNVSTSGFELAVKTEELYTGLVYPEKVSYLAIVPGKGAIGEKRITVGSSEEWSGVSADPIELDFDSSYTEPAIFACLQTDADDFAATLRYTFDDDNRFNIHKLREYSAGTSQVNEDQFCWMAIDLASGQVIDNIVELNIEAINLYPNPVADILFLDLNQTSLVEIYDISGNKLIEIIALNKINISNLAAGIYILKTEGRLPEKFIKL